jgi:UDP-N-acetylmuramoyl-L-alanyl-D-glutamate--2,6-diaminopimelate ligase
VKTVAALGAWLEAQPLPAGAIDEHSALRGVSCDSRALRRDELYVALAGGKVHGAQFAEEATANGAVAAVSDRPLDGLPTFVVPDPRRTLGPLAAWFFDDPSDALSVIGVTGTNGKTTTTFLVDAGIRGNGRRSGLVSTIENRVDGHRTPSVLTTPEAPELQRLLSDMRGAGTTAAGVEVSSHALAMGRVDGTRFAAAVFTNLSHDHLDFHHDMETYYRVKRGLFRAPRCAIAVVNLDDLYGRRLARETDCPVVGFSRFGNPDAIWQAESAEAEADGVRFKIEGPAVSRELCLPLVGLHNVDNTLGAVAALTAIGFDPNRALDGMEQLDGVPGRFQAVSGRSGRCGVVDYAHNPDGLCRVLEAARATTTGKVIVVFGAPGDRDVSKRPIMGRIAIELADLAIITTDDPWSEDPEAIAAAVMSGAASDSSNRIRTILDREAAIAAGVNAAQPGDVVVVAGRGHEQLQTFRDRTVRFDDVEILRTYLD